MSTLKADTIVAADGSSPVTLTKQSAAKHWVTIDGTGTVTALDSFNTSSVTDTATARYTPAITNAFSNANYAVGAVGNLVFGTDYFYVVLSDANAPTTSSYELMTCGSAGSQVDVDRTSAIAHGDLA